MAVNAKPNGGQTNNKIDFTTVDNLFHGGGNGYHNPSEIFMTPGSTPGTASDLEKILMKSYIDDRDEAVAITNLASRCYYLNNDMGLQDLIIFLSAKASIRGAARTYGLQASVVAIAPDVLQTVTDGRRSNNNRSVFGRVRDHFGKGQQNSEEL